MNSAQWATFLRNWRAAVPPLLRFYGAVGLFGLLCLAYFSHAAASRLTPIPLTAFLLVVPAVLLLSAVQPVACLYHALKRAGRQKYTAVEALGLLAFGAALFLLTLGGAWLVFGAAPLSSLPLPFALFAVSVLYLLEKHNRDIDRAGLETG